MRIFSLFSDVSTLSEIEKKEIKMRYTDFSKLIHQDLKGLIAFIQKYLDEHGLVKEIQNLEVSLIKDSKCQIVRTYSANGNKAILFIRLLTKIGDGAGIEQEPSSIRSSRISLFDTIKTQHYKHSAKVGNFDEKETNEIPINSKNLENEQVPSSPVAIVGRNLRKKSKSSKCCIT